MYLDLVYCMLLYQSYHIIESMMKQTKGAMAVMMNNVLLQYYEQDLFTLLPKFTSLVRENHLQFERRCTWFPKMSPWILSFWHCRRTW